MYDTCQVRAASMAMASPVPCFLTWTLLPQASADAKKREARRAIKELNDPRKTVVKRAFQKLDRDGSGVRHTALMFRVRFCKRCSSHRDNCTI